MIFGLWFSFKPWGCIVQALLVELHANYYENIIGIILLFAGVESC